MKKRILGFIAALVASAFFMPDVLAMSEPEVVTIDGQEMVFANGTPITITARTDDLPGARIVWGDGETGVVDVGANATVFGGSHAQNLDSTSVTMRGGTIRNLIGGGLHASTILATNVEVYGGVITGGLMGGSASSLVHDEHDPWYSSLAKEASTRVVKANIHVYNLDGKLYALYGGGEGISYTGEASVIVDGGVFDYVISGGSNGYTGDAELKMNGGTTTYLFAGNRGSMKSSSIIVDGATVGRALVAGGDEDDNDCTFEEGASMEIISGTINSLSAGTNGAGVSATDIVTATYHEGSVTTVEDDTFAEDSLAATVTFTFHSLGEAESMEVPKGMAYSEEELASLKEELKNIALEEGYEFLGLYTDEECTIEADLTQAINADIDIYMKVAQLRQEEEPNVNTADFNVILAIGVLILSGTGLVYTLRKRKFS